MTEQNPEPRSGNAPDNWERQVITQLALEGLREQKLARRWRIVMFFLVITLMTVSLLGPYLLNMASQGRVGKHTALVDLSGVISADSDASADRIVTGLRAAFEDRNTVGVILRINSPGGSPVQSGYINDEIERLRSEYPDIPLYAVVMDICASGGYYVAAAADRIYADKASVVGSIGVRFDGFGFVDAIDRLGIERRLMTAGEHKGLLDPFLPEGETEKAHMQDLLDAIHQQFIDTVKRGRGDRLADDPAIFSGLVWTGDQALALGLVDELGSAGYVAREVIGESNIVDFTPRKSVFDRFLTNLGASVAKGAVEAVTEPTLR
ncbi:MAG: S49 family peptidase [Chromatiales bacterium]|nr:S49 family peptidase [Chromatiales bacterium]